MNVKATVVAVGTLALPPKKGLRVVAFDPSLTCSGLALVDVARDSSIAVRRIGYIDGPDAKRGPLWYRCLAIAEAVERFLQECGDVDVTVVEMPMEHTRGLKKARSKATLPGYGVCVGAVAAAVSRIRSPDHRYYPSATLWGSSSPSGGDDKPLRVQTVGILTGLSLAKEFGRGRAGNVADAVLIGRWGGLQAMQEGNR